MRIVYHAPHGSHGRLSMPSSLSIRPYQDEATRYAHTASITATTDCRIHRYRMADLVSRGLLWTNAHMGICGDIAASENIHQSSIRNSFHDPPNDSSGNGLRSSPTNHRSSVDYPRIDSCCRESRTGHPGRSVLSGIRPSLHRNPYGSFWSSDHRMP